MLQKSENILEIGADNRDSLFIREPKILSPTFVLLIGSGGNKQNSRDFASSMRFVDELLKLDPKDNTLEGSAITSVSKFEEKTTPASMVKNDCLKGTSASIMGGDIEEDTLQCLYSASLVLNEAISLFPRQTTLSSAVSNHESPIMKTKDIDSKLVANSILNTLDVKDCAKVEKYLQGLSSADASIMNIQTAEKDVITTRSKLDAFGEKNIEIVETISFLQNASPVV